MKILLNEKFYQVLKFLMPCKRLFAKNITPKHRYYVEENKNLSNYFIKPINISLYKTTYEILRNYIVKPIIEEYPYKFAYCVSYRPYEMSERILARGWWNDKGEWFEKEMRPFN